MDKLKPILDAKNESLRDLYDAHEDQIEAWQEHVHDAMKDDGKGAGRHGHHGDMGPLGIMMSKGPQMAAKFLLWDGTMPPEPPAPAAAAHSRNKDLGKLTVSPNPSMSNATVRMNKLPSGPTTIEVFDMNGALVRSTQTQVADGQLRETISTDGLPPGTYMVSVNTPEGRRSQSLLITK